MIGSNAIGFIPMPPSPARKAQMNHSDEEEEGGQAVKLHCLGKEEGGGEFDNPIFFVDFKRKTKILLQNSYKPFQDL